MEPDIVVSHQIVSDDKNVNTYRFYGTERVTKFKVELGKAVYAKCSYCGIAHERHMFDDCDKRRQKSGGQFDYGFECKRRLRKRYVVPTEVLKAHGDVLTTETSRHIYTVGETVQIDGERATIEEIIREPQTGVYLVHTSKVVASSVDEESKILAKKDVDEHNAEVDKEIDSANKLAEEAVRKRLEREATKAVASAPESIASEVGVEETKDNFWNGVAAGGVIVGLILFAIWLFH